mgnify:CR=1 FL=1
MMCAKAWLSYFSSLQMDMGHSSLSLLRTRYLNMEGISRRESAAFWQLNHNALFIGPSSSGSPEKTGTVPGIA